MNLLAIDVFRTEGFGFAKAQLTTIRNNGLGSVQISNKTIGKQNQTFKELVNDIVGFIIDKKPENILIDSNGLGFYLQEDLTVELANNNTFILPNGFVKYKNKSE